MEVWILFNEEIESSSAEAFEIRRFLSEGREMGIDVKVYHPEQFDLVVDDQDHSADWLRRGEVSAAITSHGKPIAGCDVTNLGALRYIATASPAFIQKWFPTGVTVQALSRAPCIIFNTKDNLQNAWLAENFPTDPPMGENN